MMKYTIVLLFTTLFMACNSNKTTVDKQKDQATQKVEQVVREITATKNESGYLIGVANKASFQDEAFKGWYDSRYEEYTTDKETISNLTDALKGHTIKAFMGTWCGDSKRETPRFYKILEETGFNENNVEMITVGRNKSTPDNLQEGFDVIKVPTFIFFKDDKEVGRIVEYPRESLEKDMLKIVTGEPYKHSYDRSE